MDRKQWDRVYTDDAIGVQGEFAMPFRLGWDAGFGAAPARLVRRHHIHDGVPERTRRVTRYRKKSPAPEREMTVTERAVRDYRRAWRAIHKTEAA